MQKVIPPPKPVKKPKVFNGNCVRQGAVMHSIYLFQKKKPMPQIVEETFCLQDILIREEPPKIPDEDIAKPVKKVSQILQFST